MASESLDCCRLCSSSRNLISMFSGRSRTIRNSLRKMIQEMVHIQIKRADHITSVCFNCLVDVSNFYFFKLHCIQNQEQLKDIEDSCPNIKKFKLSTVPIEILESPDILSTEEVLEWLSSKKNNILESQHIPIKFANKESQTDDKYIKKMSKLTQTDNSSNFEDNRNKKKKISKNCCSQTEPKILSQKVRVISIEPNISTQNRSMQTEVPKLVEKDQQCDVINGLGQICYNIKHTRASPFMDQVFVNDLTEKDCQTDPPKMMSVNIQCDFHSILNEFYNKDMCVLPTSNLYSKDMGSKLNLKLTLKEEKLSPLEALTIPTSPLKVDMHPANLSDLLQIKCNKSHCVHICKICDKTLYSKREIVQHNKVHLQCHFCKKKFRTIENTQNHMNYCKVKQVNVLPFIHLVRVDLQADIKEKYPAAFNVS